MFQWLLCTDAVVGAGELSDGQSQLGPVLSGDLTAHSPFSPLEDGHRVQPSRTPHLYDTAFLDLRPSRIHQSERPTVGDTHQIHFSNCVCGPGILTRLL